MWTKWRSCKKKKKDTNWKSAKFLAGDGHSETFAWRYEGLKSSAAGVDLEYETALAYGKHEFSTGIGDYRFHKSICLRGKVPARVQDYVTHDYKCRITIK